MTSRILVKKCSFKTCKNIVSRVWGNEKSHTLLLGAKLVWPLGELFGQSLVTF